MEIFIVVTAFKEERTIGKAVEQIILATRDLKPLLKLIIVAPDGATLKSAEMVCKSMKFDSYVLSQDLGKGKPEALNNAYNIIRGVAAGRQENSLLMMTDGDVYIDNAAIKYLLNHFQDPKVGGVGGHPVSSDSRDNFFGYISHLFCEAANVVRMRDSRLGNDKLGRNKSQINKTPMSGYLYAIRLIDGIFPIDPKVRAEDAYVSQKLLSKGYEIEYDSKAIVYVKFPKNLSDWINQKSRSLGGNIQLNKLGMKSARSIFEDLHMILFPIFFAKTLKELIWSILLYPLRFYLWMRIYITNITNKYKYGAWKRIDSTK